MLNQQYKMTSNKSIQTVKLNIINRITSIEDKLLLKQVWDIISSNDEVEHSMKKYTKEEKEILSNIKKGIEEVKLIEQNKLKATPLKDLLDEI